MSRDERAAYRRYWDNRAVLLDQIVTARGEGRLEGIAEGITQTARKMLQMGIDKSLVSQTTGLSFEQLDNLN